MKNNQNNSLAIRNSTAEFLIFATQNESDSIEVRFEEGTLWLYRNPNFNPDINYTINAQSGTANAQSGTANGPFLSNKESVVVMQLRKKENITAQQLEQTTKIPLRTIKRILSRLTAKGIIRRVGSDKTGHWEVLR